MKLLTVIAVLANMLVAVLTALDGDYIFTIASLMYGFSVWLMYVMHVSSEKIYWRMLNGRGR